MSGRRGVFWISAAIGVAALAGCSSNSPEIKPISTADAYTAVIDWYADSIPAPPPTTNGDAPGPEIVYVVSESGGKIADDVQASVAANMVDRKDEVTVFFADDRDEALDVDLEDQPVKDRGVLLVVGEIEEAKPPISVDVRVYRTMADVHAFSMKIFRSGDEVTATGETVVTQG